MLEDGGLPLSQVASVDTIWVLKSKALKTIGVCLLIDGHQATGGGTETDKTPPSQHIHPDKPRTVHMPSRYILQES